MNLQEIQKQFTQAIRNPKASNTSLDIPEQRMQLYQKIMFNNLDELIKSNFPLTNKQLSGVLWDKLIQDFLFKHKCTKPLFSDIPEEFLLYLQNECQIEDLPVYLLDLAHYEWVELALEFIDAEFSGEVVDINYVNNNPLFFSSLSWLLVYHFPVHQISATTLASEINNQMTYLVAYRDRSDTIATLEINDVTARLLQLISDTPGQYAADVLQQITAELNHLDSEALNSGGLNILKDFYRRGIITLQ